MVQTTATKQGSKQAGDKNAIRPFHVNFPEADLTELRRRITATRLPEKETVTDFSQGVPLATTQKLARYWATEYDWRKVEARLNAVPNFITVPCEMIATCVQYSSMSERMCEDTISVFPWSRRSTRRRARRSRSINRRRRCRASRSR